MGELIKPTSDMFIHYLFGKEENNDILKSFVNAVLEDSDFPILKKVTVQNPFNLKAYKNDKLTILDIKAEDESGKIYDIEVQSSGNKMYANRSLYYWARLYADQLKESEIYKELNPVICINLLDFKLIKESDKAHTCFMAYEKDNFNLLLSDHFEIHFIEFPKFKEKMNKLKHRLSDWLLYFTKESLEGKEMGQVLKKNPIILKAHKEYKKFNSSKEIRELHEAREKAIKDRNSLIDSAKEEGIEEGIEQGIELGKKENSYKIAISLLCLLDNVVIAEKTGLTLDEVNNLEANSHKK